MAVELLRSAANLLEGVEFQELKGLLLGALDAGDSLAVQELLQHPGCQAA